MLIQNIIQQSKQLQKYINNAQLITIHQNNNHFDIFTINLLIHYLSQQKQSKEQKLKSQVTFIAIRQNYAHYSALAKKFAFSLQPSLKNKSLQYIQLFQHSYCQQLPLLQTSPNSYIPPPKTIQNISISKLNNVQLQPKSVLIIDSLSFFQQHNIQLLSFYEKAVNLQCKIVIAGMNSMINQSIQNIIERQSVVSIALLNDIGGYGKFQIFWNQSGTKGNQKGKKLQFLWKFAQGRFQISRHAIL